MINNLLPAKVWLILDTWRLVFRYTVGITLYLWIISSYLDSVIKGMLTSIARVLDLSYTNNEALDFRVNIQYGH